MEELENLDDSEDIPSSICIFPPDHDDNTDEDSGEEDSVNINNLPGNQLTAEAEVIESEAAENSDSTASQNEPDESTDSEDNIPLSRLVKKEYENRLPL